MPRRRQRGHGKLTEIIKNGFNYAKWKIGSVNDYFKQKRFVHQLIGPQNFALPLNAISHAWGINKKLENNFVLKTLDNLGYGKHKRKRNKKKHK